ncbi:hypothetical protein EJ08DRAFT_697847 [Tothia fuscella]|uniref:protein O-GlcNAc transferase n=1 Tax=Tothia fuscella TaxID=1048955 RepID=A0A9P4TYN5_9PEZI|nr:hypothetical protein EJ08DRAFT_697847 [Tothia fuscella]
MATSMIRPHLPSNPPPPVRPPYLSRHPSDSLYDYVSPSSSLAHSPAPNSPYDGHCTPNQNSRHQVGHSQMPLRYAHPLQRNNSYPSHTDSKDSGEHMLRRKTPNGILNAAYDGNSVEQNERPHALKHIVLPLTDQFSAGRAGHQRDMAAFRPPMQHLDSFSHHMNNQWANELQFGTDPSNGTWNINPPHLPQIDSMLNQMPSHTPHLQYMHNGYHPYAFMPPTFQSSFGPTASNDTGPYGPYWPNGTFVPYRPAALRDMRYYPHSSTWTGHPIPNDGSFQNGNWYPMNQQRADIGSMGGMSGLGSMGNMTSMGNLGSLANLGNMGNRSYPTQQALSAAMQDSLNSQQSFPGFYSAGPLYPEHQTRTNNLSSMGDGPAAYPTNTALRMPAVQPLEPQPRYDSGPSSGQTTPTPHNYQNVQSSLGEFGAGSSNAIQREKVFSWAHTIYIDLLKYLHGVRRRAHHDRRNGTHNTSPPGPNIYPRPPRQPSADFSAHTNTHRSKSHPENQRPVLNLQQHSSSHNSESSTRSGSQQDLAPRVQSSSPWLPSGQPPNSTRHHTPQWQTPQYASSPLSQQHSSSHSHPRTLRRTSGSLHTNHHSGMRPDISHVANATSALDTLADICGHAGWKWVDGMLLGGCLAYALGNYARATDWYSKILAIDSSHVEAMSNLAATMLATNRKSDAETYWRRAVKLRPSYFEAVEHLIGLLCGESRGKEAVSIIEFVQKSLQCLKNEQLSSLDRRSERSSSISQSPCLSEVSDQPVFDYEGELESVGKESREIPGSSQPGFGTSGYAVAGAENGRILQLVHAKGNMLYAMGDNMGAAKAFEEAVMVGVGRQFGGIDGLIKHILTVVNMTDDPHVVDQLTSTDPVLLNPSQALDTAKLCFPPHGDMPGLSNIASDGQARKAVISTTSNSLLSLAKIFQDGMASNTPRPSTSKTVFGVREILALYYLSLSLQPSPSTANNVGILLASVQQVAPSRSMPMDPKTQLMFPGVTSGSGIHLALQYYNYGLNLDKKHAHLYTNFGSLLKDIGQLTWAIQMYEQAVQCDPNFDIALANLANAVKDTGRIADAIGYYRRAVSASPDFAEAVCGLANALNSVCGWQGRGGIATRGGKYDRWHVGEDNMLKDARMTGAQSSGWIKRVVDLVEKQLADGEGWGRGIINANFVEKMLSYLPVASGGQRQIQEKETSLATALQTWSGEKWEGARVIRLVERIIKRLTWQWYQDKHVKAMERPANSYTRPQLPSNMTVPAAPTVLPFHTFTCPMSAKQIRHISQRNGLRISCSTLKAPWLSTLVHPPPAPPNPTLKVGYVSSDFNNHPLAHLMQSVFGLHDRKRVEAYCYATTTSDNSSHRKQIEEQSPHFYDATTWPAEKLVDKIVEDGIHILINLNGYTRGARNEVFAARPAPIQMSFMGFAGTLGAEWCDYLLADETAIPPDTLRPWRRNIDIEDQVEDEKESNENDDWVYGENIVFCKDTFFCCDHRQSAPDAKEKQLTWEDEQRRRWEMRKSLFPSLSDDAIILGNFNQLYKIEPTTFRTWLRILAGIPNAVLWLLRFPDLGEQYLKKTAEKWAGTEVASRVIFTDVAPKHMHISRARVCDLFLDTPECNAHTTAADVLWSGTPLLTLPRYQYKMCSRMAASILKGALPKSAEGIQAEKDLIAEDEDDYESKAIALGKGLRYHGHRPVGRLAELRKTLYEARWKSALFDTKRWVMDLEEAYEIAWERWVRGEGGDIWLK